MHPHCDLRPLCVAAILLADFAAATIARAQMDPIVRRTSGLVVVSFSAPEGPVTAYLPDDVGTGERFSGTLEGPRGFVLTLGNQRGMAGRPFHWKVPPDAGPGALALVLRNPRGREIARTLFPLHPPGPPEPEFRCPALIQAGRPFPVRGPLDGDSRTTRVTIAGRPAAPLVESVRKAIARAPENVLGPAACTITKSRSRYTGQVRGIAIDLEAPADGSPFTPRALTVRGLAGVNRDVPLEIGGDYFYLQSSEVAATGVFSTRRAFPGSRNSAVTLVIPQSRRDEVAEILRTPQRDPRTPVATQRGEALRALHFDAFPAAKELFTDFALGADAAYALLAADERRALALIFASMPDSGQNLQIIGFTWFLDRPLSTSQTAAREAHAAALRVLERLRSTAAAELAIHVVGMTGSDADVPLLERYAQAGGMGVEALRDASDAALVRLGSREHLEKIRAELASPLPPGATYQQGVRLARALRKAGLAGLLDLVPVVCTHVSDPVVVEIDISVDPGRSASNALRAIVDGIGTPAAAARSHEDWKAYCSERGR